MKRSILLLVLSSCLVLVAVSTVGAAPQQTRTFRAHLSGGEEVPAVDTNATGQAIFKLNKAGNALRYRLNVANIHDVTAAHIHLAPAGENGPVAVTLFPGPTTEGRTQGTLATGTITEDDVDASVSSWDDLLAAMADGGAYVNVHTDAHGGGEIRGQIR